ncbi:MAG: methylated-DNA--[protein]-cysteine S-methyltransferase [Phycisphaeraceae bacterium]|nr:methylated-DNA--[protein]-cysteine S-methyltransferase [Phycisphaeraceae bacterium]MCW5753437.1 methylated-DNA--[protein]-cysteine S-methyltransferase [Phycisphaeraceae bacterium]
MAQLEQELHEYFTGGRGTFSVAIALRGTPFQLRVWHELRQIPRGVTISYAELAERIGSPAAVRAVGQANRVNPVAIVIPCHRVIAADGSLHGYAGGHAVKRRLLELEGALSSDHPLLAAG